MTSPPGPARVPLRADPLGRKLATMDVDERRGLTRRELLVGGAAALGAMGAAALVGCGHAETRDDTRPRESGMKRIVILGAGFGGLETATGLSEVLRDGYEIVLVDKGDSFFVGFSKIDVLFGRKREDEVRYPYARLRARGVRFVQDTVSAIDVDARTVTTAGGARLDYDYLVVALGADLAPDATPGFVESGGHEFYSMAGARALGPVVEAFTGGTLVLGILGSPYKCPPAPYEVAYQLHDLFARKGVRERITMKVVIPSPQPVPSPGVSEVLSKLLAERAIELVTSAPIGRIDAASREVVCGDARIAYDLFVGVPVHVPPAVVRASKLGVGGFVKASPLNLETAYPGVYAIGDVSAVPAGDKVVAKAGVFAEGGARTVVSDILVKEGRLEALVKFEAKGTCYFELGGGQVAKVEADFLGGPQPSMKAVGPLPEIEHDKRAFVSTRRDRWFTSGGE